MVSDGGARIKPVAQPRGSWIEQTTRTLDLIDNQVRTLRREQIHNALATGERAGAFWSIGTHITAFTHAASALHCPPQRTAELANMPTRLAAMEPSVQERLINWGYAVADAALRTHYDQSIAEPKVFPYPEAGI
jgi:NTE family protein